MFRICVNCYNDVMGKNMSENDFLLTKEPYPCDLCWPKKKRIILGILRDPSQKEFRYRYGSFRDYEIEAIYNAYLEKNDSKHKRELPNLSLIVDGDQERVFESHDGFG